MYDNTKNRILFANYDILFHQVCLDEELYKFFNNIKLRDHEARDERFPLKYRKDLIKFQLNKLKKALANIDPLVTKISSTLPTN